MSAVRSVSGFAVEVLNCDPLFTVNHCPFLQINQIYDVRYVATDTLLNNQFSFPQICQDFLPSLQGPGAINLLQIELSGVRDF